MEFQIGDIIKFKEDNSLMIVEGKIMRFNKKCYKLFEFETGKYYEPEINYAHKTYESLFKTGGEKHQHPHTSIFK